MYRQIPVAQARPLRLEILRPGLPPETAVYPGDEDPTSLHLGACLNDRLVAVTSLFMEACPLRPDAAGWRLRGVATLPEARRRGIGGELIRRCVEHARQQRGELVWCKGRSLVADFYRSLGFQALGDEFDVPVSGPHYVFIYDLTGGDG